MQLRYNYRLSPTPSQRLALARAFGCARVVFNDGLRARQEAHEAGLPYIKDTELQKQVITAAKRTQERAWLGEVSSVVLVQSLRDLHTAYRNFFASVSGKRRGPKTQPPRFKSKRDRRQPIRLTANGFSLRGNGRLYIAKVGDLRVTWSRPLHVPPTSVTVSLDAAGRYWASFVIDTAPDILPPIENEAGIDLGLGHFAVLSDGRNTWVSVIPLSRHHVGGVVYNRAHGSRQRQHQGGRQRRQRPHQPVQASRRSQDRQPRRPRSGLPQVHGRNHRQHAALPLDTPAPQLRRRKQGRASESPPGAAVRGQHRADLRPGRGSPVRTGVRHSEGGRPHEGLGWKLRPRQRTVRDRHAGGDQRPDRLPERRAPRPGLQPEVVAVPCPPQGARLPQEAK
nr:RNA-guided endonuclease TnpB family protein [Streptomyces gossypiisoli]